MKYIYIDSLFFLSLFTDYLLCLITARICRLCLRRRRYLAAALLGAAYSVSVFLPDLSFMASRWMELVSAALMGLIAFGGERRMFRCMAVFLAVSATFGGAIWALSLQTGALPVIDLRLLIGCFAVCYTVLSIIARSRSRAADRRTAAIELSLNGRHCCFTALIDSGNCLSDPVTGAEIVVISPGALRPLLPESAALLEIADPVELVTAAGDSPELAGRMRLIPFSALGGTGLLPLDAGSFAAMRHVLFAEPKRMLSFSLSGETEQRFAAACEIFAQVQLDRRFKTLDFYKSIKNVN